MSLGLEKPQLISMFGFGWVRTHLGDFFSGEYTSFLLILVGFMEKGTKSTNLGNFGVLRYNVGIPRSSVSPRQGVACPHYDATEREAWTSLGYAEA